MNGARALLALRCSFCAFIVFASSQAFMAGLTGNGEPHHLAAHGLLALSGVEVLAALALLIPGLALAAAWVLCAVFAIAAVLTLAAGEVPLRFVYYAATAISLGLAKDRALWPQVVSKAAHISKAAHNRSQTTEIGR